MESHDELIDISYVPLLLNDFFKLLDNTKFQKEHIFYLDVLKHELEVLNFQKNQIQQKMKDPSSSIRSRINVLNNFIFYCIYYNKVDVIQYFINQHKDQFIAHLKKIKSDKIKFGRNFSNTDTEHTNGIIYCLITQNAVETLDLLIKENFEHKFNFEDVKNAVKSQAANSFAYLLKRVRLTEDQLEELAAESKELGNITMISMLLPDEPNFYFLDFLQKLNLEEEIKEDEFYLAISKAYRNSNMQHVEEKAEQFLSFINKEYQEGRKSLINATNIKNLHTAYEKAKTRFPMWASQIVRYRSPEDLLALKQIYNAKNTIEADMEFGFKNFQIIKELCSENFTMPECQPEINKQFPDCPSPKNFYSMKSLLSLFAFGHKKEAQERESKLEEKKEKTQSPDIFNTVRAKNCYTPCVNQYDAMIPFIIEMMHCNDKDVKKSSPDDTYQGNGYVITYNNTSTSKIAGPTVLQGFLPITWYHGLSSIKDIWPEIEKLNKYVFEVDSDNIRKNPSEFYEQVVKLIWLIGQLTPMERSTGRIVEQLLALVHYYHKLPIPILKLGLQLDCLDITFSLSIYQKLFLHFFEPNSLMPSAKDIVSKTEKDPELIKFIRCINKLDDAHTVTDQSLEQKQKNSKSSFPKISLQRLLSKDFNSQIKHYIKPYLIDSKFEKKFQLMEKSLLNLEKAKNLSSAYPLVKNGYMTIEDAINLNSEEKGVIDSIFNNSCYATAFINRNSLSII